MQQLIIATLLTIVLACPGALAHRPLFAGSEASRPQSASLGIVLGVRRRQTRKRR